MSSLKNYRFIRTLVALLCVLNLFSCSLIIPQGSVAFRELASSTDRLDYLLAVDRLHYYMTEFTQFHEGKQADELIDALESISAKQVLEANFTYSELSNPDKFDDLIQRLLRRHHPDIEFKRSELVWNYNFLKNKLAEAYALKESRLAKVYKNIEADDLLSEVGKGITITDVTPETLTLDSGHYISNRTTRAVFWEAVENDRTIEFHLGEARDFVKNVEANGGEVLYEVNPMARNYNKIFLVQYPGEEEYRYAITNIGGHDRLEHLVHQVSLSNLSNKKIKSEVKVIGELDDYHDRLTRRIKGRLELLPKADRLVIGQKGAIDTVFTLQWKKLALKNLYADDPDAVASALGVARNEVSPIIGESSVVETLANKGKIEKSFAALADHFEEKPQLLPSQFKQFDWDINVAEMADYVFKDNTGKTVRWRVVSNVWGDEIVPVAKALKETGHNHVTYMGTAGAFPDKGIKVGDLVIPSHYLDKKGKMVARGTALNIEGAKVGGVVEHVGSPFEETFQWMDQASARSDLVEIETNYLGRIFNGNDDHVRSYLLVSDILGSEGETLANASSSKRRNSLNKLLDAVFSRDKAHLSKPNETINLTGNALKHWNLREAVEKALSKNGVAFKYHVYATFNGTPSIQNVADHASTLQTFTDDFHSKKLVEASEALTAVVNRIKKVTALPNFAVPISFLDGKWNPKSDPLKILLLATNKKVSEEYKRILEESSDVLSPSARWLQVEVLRGQPPTDFAKIKIPSYVDADLLIRVFSDGGYARFGLDSLNTYTGNPKYVQLPTVKSASVCDTTAKFCSLSYFEPDERTRELLEQLPSLRELGASQTNRQALEEAVRQLDLELQAKAGTEEFAARAEMKVVNSLPDGKLAEIVPEFSPTKGLVVKLNITQNGLNNSGVVLEEMAHLSQITGDYFQHPLFWAEMTLNAKHGSRKSQHYLAKAEIDAIDLILDGYIGDVEVERIEEYLQARKSNAEKMVDNIKKAANQETKDRRAFGDQWKQLQTNLENQNLKLNDYIARNDRRKVRELVEAFMPWHEMEPTEVAVWTRWLDAMTEEVPKSEKVVLFRGLSGDLISKTDEGQPYLMAKLLTKNQGNYTRRLRSLKTYRTKMTKNVSGEVPINQASLAMVMKAHSHDPFGSPFMSAADMSIAASFADGYEFGSDKAGLAAIHINPKRLIYNHISDYGENEHLIPLILFPDEIAHLEEITDESTFSMSQFKASVEGKLGRALSNKEKNAATTNPLSATKAWWDLVNPEGLTPNKVPRTCKDVMQMFMQVAH